MRKITVRNVLLSIGMSAFVLVAATLPALAMKAPARALAETTKSAHFYSARDWKRRHRASAASRRLVKPRGYARVYNRGSYPRPPDSYETDLLLDCLMSEPFVICP
jgi:hypothetical protein